MKIAYLTNHYPHVRHTFIRREIVALEQQGIEVVRYSIRDSGVDLVDPADRQEYAKTSSLLAAGKARLLWAWIITMFARPGRWCRAFVWTIRLGRRSDRGVLRHLAYFAEACLLRQRLLEAKVSHLHVHFATNPAAVALLCKILGGPTYSITIHGPEEWDRPEALSLKDKYENAAFVVAVSDYGRCQVYRWTDRAYWPRVHVVRCGVDDAYLRLEPLPVPDSRRLVLVAGFVEQKAHLLLLEALAQVRQAGVEFEMVFVGDGPLRLAIEGAIQQLNLGDVVRLVGWQSNAVVRQHLQTSRALIMPSFAENLPVAMMESLAMGRPVLGTYIAGIPELVENHQTGWLVPAGNVAATTQAIQQILECPLDTLNQLGRNGAERVRANHDASQEAAKLAKLFRAYSTGED